jgi:sister-chromatid-cohesion protein PDS5
MIRRWMQALHQELTEHDPDEFQVESLAQVRTDLVHRSILFHKEYASSHPLHIPKRMEGEKLTPELVSRVKAYAACCIADILKYYAPDAPYDSQGIRVSTLSTVPTTYLTP